MNERAEKLLGVRIENLSGEEVTFGMKVSAGIRTMTAEFPENSPLRPLKPHVHADGVCLNGHCGN